MAEVPVIVLGGAGYVAGELLRLLAFHPRLQPRAVVSRSQAGRSVPEIFPHLCGVWDDLEFVSEDALSELIDGSGPIAAFSCLPHGEAAARLDDLLSLAEERGTELRLVDLSADFRLRDASTYEAVYGSPHGAPERFASFICGLPELSRGEAKGAVAHPGCFTTAVTLACAPAQAAGVADPVYRVSAITGSTGSGRAPSATTHHPDRHASLKAYKPLSHRHAPEMERLLAAVGGPSPEVHFVPHSGPFARGIHATVHLSLPSEGTNLFQVYEDFYQGAPFVTVSETPPVLKNVVGTNRCHLGVCVEGRTAVVFSVIDNLTKGAAGGAVHWMNCLLGFDEDLGLRLPALGWS